MARTVMWFRRDLRLADNPALLAAAGRLGTREAAAPGDQREVLALYVLDPHLLSRAGAPRRAYLHDSLRALAEAIEDAGGRLAVVTGDPVVEVPRVANRVGAEEVHVAADFAPYGAARDDAVEQALTAQDRRLVRTGSPYAVAPGRVRKGDGEPYRVFTPFRAAWLDHGWRAPVPAPDGVRWLEPPRGAGGAVDGEGTRALEARPDVDVPEAGEGAARALWEEFLDDGLDRYQQDRDRPDLAGTSRLSIALRWGEIHPRTLLADLTRLGQDGRRSSGMHDGVASFRSELAWREFFADALWHTPTSARTSLHAVVPEDAWVDGVDEDAALEAWAAGRTGYPFVDAGMRQLAAAGWMHGRVRMVTASFLVKDLHVRWRRGARHFMRHLLDGDLASNQHNWQWVAGTGLDAAPYFRIFNPVTQGTKFDPHGDYVRRWVPELRDVPGAAVHEPWRLRETPAGYPERMLDHSVERKVALDASGRR
ncbi:cryptochrome/photolyase family protein [Miniimonas arenae]|uniref:cryptochrome/photolyase family protein n=1 Tax=Miniimonas arenae TaxID=676201 RepID=UPI0028AC0BB2|nr:deoxyribodipyrimidine photo-lyase [Miniimonas arenae]